MRKSTAAAAILLTLTAVFAAAQGQNSRTLDIYLVDVEGGNATLFVSPARESLLIDTGNGGMAAVRDADRIMAAVNDAGLKQIDRLITTHYHGDHYGAMAELSARIPIRHFIDHGRNAQPNPGTDAFLEKDCMPEDSTPWSRRAIGSRWPAWTCA
jgi:glyoxylase-like metal-dependent hydrolase (beta-lactamase superfamily II)